MYHCQTHPSVTWRYISPFKVAFSHKTGGDGPSCFRHAESIQPRVFVETSPVYEVW